MNALAWCPPSCERFDQISKRKPPLLLNLFPTQPFGRQAHQLMKEALASFPLPELLQGQPARDFCIEVYMLGRYPLGCELHGRPLRGAHRIGASAVCIC